MNIDKDSEAIIGVLVRLGSLGFHPNLNNIWLLCAEQGHRFNIEVQLEYMAEHGLLRKTDDAEPLYYATKELQIALEKQEEAKSKEKKAASLKWKQIVVSAIISSVATMIVTAIFIKLGLL